MTSIFARIVLIAAVALVPVAAGADTPTRTLSIDVLLPMVGDNGKSLDGGRIYVLPMEMTTESGPEPAVCVSTDADETVCMPRFGDPSPCPDSYRCTLNVTFMRPFEAFTVSVFDIDGIPQDIRKASSGAAERGLSMLEEWTGTSLGMPSVADALENRGVYWSWIESVSFVPLPIDGDNYAGDADAERAARVLANDLAPLHKVRFSKGRIAAPFRVMAAEECIAPLPPCSFNYVHIAIEEDIE